MDTVADWLVKLWTTAPGAVIVAAASVSISVVALLINRRRFRAMLRPEITAFDLAWRQVTRELRKRPEASFLRGTVAKLCVEFVLVEFDEVFDELSRTSAGLDRALGRRLSRFMEKAKEIVALPGVSPGRETRAREMLQCMRRVDLRVVRLLKKSRL